ncbi:PAS domain S-box protein [Thiomicrorhabdus sp. 6S2-11]|uniref:histidine kinase n=1 Tax=Thiomicrorhabdus marina TaxID=2818442 RepID=A0ABS3Q5M1_9GAMM|nr:PAS domain S-box protein [Thiomicrorhabdus marina]MBO1927628.1 PAS domain S-box protein [Thiomicrorhabdus marina]
MPISTVLPDRFAQSQKQVLTRLLGILVAAALLLVPLSWLRIEETGFHSTMVLHSVMLAVLLAAWVGNKYLSPTLIASLLLILLTALGVVASFESASTLYAVGFFVTALMISGLYFNSLMLLLIGVAQAAYIGYFYSIQAGTVVDALVSAVIVFTLALITIFISRTSQQNLFASNQMLIEQKEKLAQQSQQLEKEHHILEAAFNISMDGLIEVDFEQERAQLSEHTFAILGISGQRRNLHFSEFVELIDQRDRFQVQQAFSEFSKGGTSLENLQYRVLRSGEKPSWVQENCQVTEFDHLGNPKKALCVIKDISQQKKAEEVISAKEQVLSRVVEAAGQGIWQAKRFGDYWDFEFSPSFYQIIGHVKPIDGHFSLLQFIELIHPADQNSCMQAFYLHMASNKPYQIEFRVLTEQGQTRWVSASGLFLEPDAKGNPRRNIGSLRDITLAKELQAELVRSKEYAESERVRLHTLMDTVSNGIHLVDESATVIEANHYFLDMLGYEQNDVGHLNVADFEMNFDAKGIQKVLHNLRERPNNTLVFDSKNRRKDGSILDVQVTLKLVDISGKQVFFAMSRDITERKIYEQELLQAKQEAEQAAAAKSQFLANMSHEIRTPLNATMNFLQFVEDSALNAEQRNYVYKAQQASHHLLDLLVDILDFSKIDAGTVELLKKPFDVLHLASQLKSQLQHKAEKKGLSFQVHLDSSLPHYLVGDSKRLLQVLLNITSNAIKYTKKGSVEVQLNLLSKKDREVSLECCVKDTGVGIDESILPTLFDPFTQVDNSHTRAESGVGLGLSISKQLLMMMDSQLQVNSAVGQGSTFSFQVTLPKADSLEQIGDSSKQLEHKAALILPSDDENLPAPAKDLNGFNILVAEDNLLNQESMQIMLSKMGATVDLVEDGVEAVQVMQERGTQFDLVLMDIQMPVLDGIAATKQIRNLFELPHIPIIALTASSQQSDRKAAEQAGMDAYLLKPFDRAALLQLVSSLSITPSIKVDSEHAEEPKTLPKGHFSLPGFDIEQALYRLDGSQETLQRMFDLFVNSIQDTVPKLHELFDDLEDERNRQELRKILHRVIGSSSVVGATELIEKLKNIQQQLKETDDVSEIPWSEVREQLFSSLEKAQKQLQNFQFRA